MISEAERTTYRTDGVVHLSQVFDLPWIETLRAGVDRNMAEPGPHFEARTLGESSARYCEDFWAWNRVPEFGDFVRHSPVGELGGSILAAPSANLVMDNWFLREAGATSRAPWHHDIAYFDFEGTMCVAWIPLDETQRTKAYPSFEARISRESCISGSCSLATNQLPLRPR
jgi:ectoine hydroxylase-related dioxygenase (phytanoyl-CoA dioxygenase family)